MNELYGSLAGAAGMSWELLVELLLFARLWLGALVTFLWLAAKPVLAANLFFFGVASLFFGTAEWRRNLRGLLAQVALRRELPRGARILAALLYAAALAGELYFARKGEGEREGKGGVEGDKPWYHGIDKPLKGGDTPTSEDEPRYVLHRFLPPWVWRDKNAPK